MNRENRPSTPPLKTLAYGLGVLGGAGVLAACGHSAPTRFFTLDPIPPASAPPTPAYATTPIKVLAVNIPPSLDRVELVSEEGDGQMKVHDFEHWEAPLGQTARQALIQDLAARLPSGAVVAPNTPGGGGVALLNADVVGFQVGAGGATLQAAWSLMLPSITGAPSPQVWRSAIRQYQAPVTATGGAATAQAFSALLGQLADQIAAQAPAETARLQARQQMEKAQLETKMAPPPAPARTITTRKTRQTRSTATPGG